MKTKPRYLLDTNVISEVRRTKADPRVTRFLLEAGTPYVFLSVLTLGELREGALRIHRSDPVFADRLTRWIEEIELEYANRLLGVDAATAALWGELSAARTRPVVDTLLVATAIAHNLTFVTRNTRDVEDTGVTLLNPWA